MSTNSASFNAGYGRSAGQENRMVEYSTRDANGNRVIVDGVMLTGSDQSVYSTSRTSRLAGRLFGRRRSRRLCRGDRDRQQPDGHHPGQQQHGHRQFQPGEQRQRLRRLERREGGTPQ
jgi:hypothetical protein